MPPWIAYDERSSGLPDVTMDRPRDRHEIAIAAQHQGGAAGRSHPDGAQRLVDDPAALVPPAEQAREEAAQRAQQRALRDQRDAAEPDLQPRRQHELAAPRAIDPHAVLAGFIAEQPSGLAANQASVQARHAARVIVELESAGLG